MQYRQLFSLKLSLHRYLCFYFHRISFRNWIANISNTCTLDSVHVVCENIKNVRAIWHAGWIQFGLFEFPGIGDAFYSRHFATIILGLVFNVTITAYISRTMNHSTGSEANIFQLKIWCTWMNHTHMRCMHTHTHIIVHGQMIACECIVLCILRLNRAHIVDSF